MISAAAGGNTAERSASGQKGLQVVLTKEKEKKSDLLAIGALYNVD